MRYSNDLKKTSKVSRQRTLDRKNGAPRDKNLVENQVGLRAKVLKSKILFLPWYWRIAHLTLTAATFFWTYVKYNGFTVFNSTNIANPTQIQYQIQTFQLRPFIGISKASAAVINLQLGLVLIPVTRSLVSALRSSFVNHIMPFDFSIGAHKAIGKYFIAFTIIHVVAHMFNYRSFTNKIDVLPVVQNLASGIPSYWSLGVTEYLWITTFPGWSGIICEVLAFLGFTAALAKVRARNFELFYYSHHLFFVMFLFLVPHGESCLVSSITSTSCKSGGDFKKSAMVGALFYFVDRIVIRQVVRNPESSRIVKVIRHPGQVMELHIEPPFSIGGSLIVNRSVPGSAILINCPKVSKHEYHPFTLTNCPSMGVWSVHIRCVGDWTTKFAECCGITFTEDDTKSGIENLPAIKVDGPFISECIDAIKHPVSLLIGAGIGVTPFAGILRDILTRIITGNTSSTIKKVYFIWICRGTNSFEWFIELLREFDGYFHMVEPYIYITQMENPMAVMLEPLSQSSDVITGLPFPSQFGRPNWFSIFAELNKTHQHDEIGVFVSGPKSLSDEVKQVTDSYGNMEFNYSHFQ